MRVTQTQFYKKLLGRIGEKKAAKLLIKYKTKENLQKATIEELALTAGVSLETAKELYEVIHS